MQEMMVLQPAGIPIHLLLSDLQWVTFVVLRIAPIFLVLGTPVHS